MANRVPCHENPQPLLQDAIKPLVAAASDRGLWVRQAPPAGLSLASADKAVSASRKVAPRGAGGAETIVRALSFAELLVVAFEVLVEALDAIRLDGHRADELGQRQRVAGEIFDLEYHPET